MTDTQLLHILALQHIPKIGDITAKKLIAHCGSAEAVLNEKRQNLLKIEGVGSSMLREINPKLYLDAAENELRFIRKNNITVRYFMDPDYPVLLKHCIDSPLILFTAGNIDLNKNRSISIVGTRNITNHGIAFCERLVEELKPFDPMIISGFAYGTDITAQKAAIQNGLQTIGCLAHGLNQIYPKVHKKYVSEVEKHGGFITDFWSTDTFDRNNFLKRNRIIAGLSQATIVIESAEKGGSLVTADIANSYNRDVFAVPGRTTDSQSVGCNDLIKQQKAHLLSTPLDIAYMLDWKVEANDTRAVQKKLFVELEEEEKIIYKYLIDNGKEQLDLIALKCEIPIYKVASLLLNMELKGAIRPLPGKLFEVI